jgi:putative SbcD/Mre11-related phosphoesterase
MKIDEEIELIDIGIFCRKISALIISDTQLGYEESLNKQGIMIPRRSFEELKARLDSMIKIVEPRKIIINGDIKHEFGSILRSEWKQTLELVDFLKSRADLILIRGNHDTILGPIAEQKDIKIVEYCFEDGYYMVHGHKIPKDLDFKRAKTVIIGHEHPAVTLREGARSEKFKCFLHGRFKDKEIFVLPSCNLLTQGTDILRERLMSPFLDDISDFEVYVVADKILKFGTVENILKESG